MTLPLEERIGVAAVNTCHHGRCTLRAKVAPGAFGEMTERLRPKLIDAEIVPGVVAFKLHTAAGVVTVQRDEAVTEIEEVVYEIAPSHPRTDQAAPPPGVPPDGDGQ